MKIGIITYHSAYNFGSVLQAYATQKAIEKLGYENEIINYVVPFQRKYYKLLGYGKGVKGIVKSVLMIPLLKQRVERARKYDEFIKSMKLTDSILHPSEISKVEGNFDTFISGSDQIWNLHSNEFINSEIEFMDPYLLEFTEKKKISYASSLANMSMDDINMILSKIEKFSNVSCRERDAAEKLSRALKRDVSVVLDPTLLFSKDDWGKLEICGKNYKEPYILYYSLGNYSEIIGEIKAIKKKYSNSAKIVVLAPLSPCLFISSIDNYAGAGPGDFLSLIKNAKLIITSSYHGVLFSINYNKDFYYIAHDNGDGGIRVKNILNELDILNRCLTRVELINDSDSIDYTGVNAKLDKLRKLSEDYIKNAIVN